MENDSGVAFWWNRVEGRMCESTVTSPIQHPCIPQPLDPLLQMTPGRFWLLASLTMPRLSPGSSQPTKEAVRTTLSCTANLLNQKLL